MSSSPAGAVGVTWADVLSPITHPTTPEHVKKSRIAFSPRLPRTTEALRRVLEGNGRGLECAAVAWNVTSENMARFVLASSDPIGLALGLAGYLTEDLGEQAKAVGMQLSPEMADDQALITVQDAGLPALPMFDLFVRTCERGMPDDAIIDSARACFRWLQAAKVEISETIPNARRSRATSIGRQLDKLDKAVRAIGSDTDLADLLAAQSTAVRVRLAEIRKVEKITFFAKPTVNLEAVAMRVDTLLNGIAWPQPGRVRQELRTLAVTLPRWIADPKPDAIELHWRHLLPETRDAIQIVDRTPLRQVEFDREAVLRCIEMAKLASSDGARKKDDRLHAMCAVVIAYINMTGRTNWTRDQAGLTPLDEFAAAACRLVPGAKHVYSQSRVRDALKRAGKGTKHKR